MKIAIPVWNGFVSSVFDFANQLLVVDVEAERKQNRSQIQLEQQPAPQRVSRLVELGVDVLLCGAISRPLVLMITASNIKVVPFVSGPVDEVLNAYLNGQLADPRFLQPGCRPEARRRFGCGGGLRFGRKHRFGRGARR